MHLSSVKSNIIYKPATIYKPWQTRQTTHAQTAGIIIYVWRLSSLHVRALHE